jgi:hypothetical protein
MAFVPTGRAARLGVVGILAAGVVTAAITLAPGASADTVADRSTGLEAPNGEPPGRAGDRVVGEDAVASTGEVGAGRAAGTPRTGRGLFSETYVKPIGGETIQTSDQQIAAQGCQIPAEPGRTCPASIASGTAVTVQFTAEVGVDAVVVNAGMQVTVGETRTITTTCGPVPLKPEELLFGFAIFKKRDFEVRESVPFGGEENDTVLGRGSVFEPFGMDCRPGPRP